jgi:hypothetical protein
MQAHFAHQHRQITLAVRLALRYIILTLDILSSDAVLRLNGQLANTISHNSCAASSAFDDNCCREIVYTWGLSPPVPTINVGTTIRATWLAVATSDSILSLYLSWIPLELVTSRHRG